MDDDFAPMYLYIYDECIQDKKFLRDIALVENRLTDLGIAGKIIRMALFRQAGEQIRDEARRGASTVVVVGNDHTVSQILGAVVEVGLPLGIIPLGPNNRLAEMLGIPEGVLACDVLSARNVASVDTGIINKKRFLAGVRLVHSNATLVCEDKYRVLTGEGGSIEIRNLAPVDADRATDVSDPCDGVLDARIEVPKGGFLGKRVHATKLPVRFATIETEENVSVSCDGVPLQGKRFDIHVEPLTLKVITGRERLF